MSIPPELPSERNEEALAEEFQSNTHHPPAPADEVIHENLFITQKYIELYMYVAPLVLHLYTE